jgi:hypothetical protein
MWETNWLLSDTNCLMWETNWLLSDSNLLKTESNSLLSDINVIICYRLTDYCVTVID